MKLRGRSVQNGMSQNDLQNGLLFDDFTCARYLRVEHDTRKHLQAHPFLYHYAREYKDRSEIVWTPNSLCFCGPNGM